MKEQAIFEIGRLDYIRGKYNKPDQNSLPDCYVLYPDPYMQMWRDYDQGYNYERTLLPDLHPCMESIYMLANYNFGNEDFRPEFKAGYRAFHKGVDLKGNPYIIGKEMNKWFEGWVEAQHISKKSKTGGLSSATR